jgi:hypothetical protein
MFLESAIVYIAALSNQESKTVMDRANTNSMIKNYTRVKKIISTQLYNSISIIYKINYNVKICDK